MNAVGRALLYAALVPLGFAAVTFVMIDWLHDDTHVRFEALESYCDYYPEAPGGKPGGRSMEPEPFDGERLGDAFAQLLADSHVTLG